MTIKEIPKLVQSTLLSGSFILDPYSAVRELVDNGVDAGANIISIEIDSKTGGCEYISVKDDGCGVNVLDRSMMCKKHCTSKISNYTDMLSLNSLGFRGDALFLLANISSSKGSLEIITKTSSDITGEKWYVDKKGHIKGDKRMKTSSGNGTTITVRKLLGGLKVRNIEYTKKGRITIEKIRNLINHYSINFPYIVFRLYFVSLNNRNNVEKRQIQVQPTIEKNISKERILMKLCNIKLPAKGLFFQESGISINNFVSADIILPQNLNIPEFFTSKRNCRFLTVNNRALTIKLGFGKEISSSLNSVYKNLNFPIPTCWIISLRIDSKQIDVNIEPEKNDVLVSHMENILNSFEVKLSGLLREKYNNEERPGSIEGSIPIGDDRFDHDTVCIHPELTVDIATVIANDEESNVMLMTGYENSNKGNSKAIIEHSLEDTDNENRINSIISINSNSSIGSNEVRKNDLSDISVLYIMGLSNDNIMPNLLDVGYIKSPRNVKPQPVETNVLLKESSLPTDSDVRAPELYMETTVTNSLFTLKERRKFLSRRLSMFSEFTNNYYTTNNHLNTNKNASSYHDEIRWLMRNGSLSEFITNTIRTMVNDNLEVNGSFTKTSEGWYRYSKVPDNSNNIG